MNLTIRFLLSMLCIFPAAIAMYKYKKVDKSFHPFIFMTWLEVLIEPIDFLLQKIPSFSKLGYTLLNSYTIINFFLFLTFVNNFNFISKKTFKILFITAVIIGITNYVIIHFSGMTFYLLFFVSFVMLAVSIDILTKQIMAIKQPLKNNFWFWMSGTSIIYNAQILLIFSTYFFAIHSKTLGYIFTFVNAFCYMLFAIAIIKMPQILRGKK